MAEMMKRWRMDALGRANLKIVEEAVPQPGPSEIVVKVSAVSLNFRDIMCLDKGLDFPGHNFTPCSDMCGTVTAVGDKVKRFAVGDRVISVSLPGWNDGECFIPSETTHSLGHLGGEYPGVLAEYVLLNQDWAVAAPKSVSDAEASTLPIAGVTAWSALVERGKIRAGQTALVHGTGGVAIWGAQIAQASGAEVLVVSRSEEKLSRVKALGIEKTINRSDGDWVAKAKELTGGKGVDHILETIGGAHLGRSLDAAADSGRVSLIGLFEGIEFSGMFPHLIRKHLKIEGIGIGNRRTLDDLVNAVDRAGIKPVIDQTFAFDDFPAALGALDKGAFGKLVVTL